MNTGRLAEIEADARKTLAEDAPSSLALWKPWAMDRADDVLALVEIAKAAREIRDVAKWYADNDARLAHEVDHALCVEIYSLADEALARLDSGATE